MENGFPWLVHCVYFLPAKILFGCIFGDVSSQQSFTESTNMDYVPYLLASCLQSIESLDWIEVYSDKCLMQISFCLLYLIVYFSLKYSSSLFNLLCQIL